MNGLANAVTSLTKIPFAVLCLTGFLWAGCSKSGKSTPQKAAEQTAAPPAAAAPESQLTPTIIPQQPVAARPKNPAAKSAPVATPELIGAVHPFMTQQLRIYIQQTGRMPDTFGEFASARMDSVPRPPPGLQWAIDRVTIEVKLVRQ